MHVFLGSSLLTFDGSVVEAFGSTANSNGRMHRAALDRIEVGETRKEGFLQIHTIWGSGQLMVMFPKNQKPAAEQFAAEVNRSPSPEF
jgi:hypothetical protein